MMSNSETNMCGKQPNRHCLNQLDMCAFGVSSSNKNDGANWGQIFSHYPIFLYTCRSISVYLIGQSYQCEMMLK